MSAVMEPDTQRHVRERRRERELSALPDLVKPGWFPTRAQEVVDTRTVQAVRVSHILLETESLAELALERLRQGDVDFADLAEVASICQATKQDKGQVGWVSLKDDFLDPIMPLEVREAAMALKPGDMTTVRSGRGVHIVKVEDVMALLTPTASQPRSKMPGSGQLLAASGLSRLFKKTVGAADGLEGERERESEWRYFVDTMGCQMNKADSERMAGQLESLGARVTDDAKGADIVVLNTCSIRDKAEQKVYSALGPFAARKRSGKDVTLVVAGCVAQQEGERLLRRVPELDLVMGPQYANRLGDLLEDVANGNQVVATEPTFIMEDSTKPRRESSVAAWVNVIYGCNEHCTYCVVPNTRGVEQSRPMESVRREMEELGALGFKEVTLLGQNIDSWGRDMHPKRKFSDLLHHVADTPGVERIRFVTSHPRYISERVVDAVAEHPSLMEYFHIPFQAGDNEVLRNMRRGYTRERYLHVIDRIRRRIPEVAISADVIVGFPGETEEQFEQTLDLMRQVKFDCLITAAYSPRPHTPAATWPNQLPDDVKEDRLRRINELAAQHAYERNLRYLGRVEEVLVEERNVKNPTQVMGRTRGNRLVFFDGDIAELRGRMVPVRVTEVRPYSLTGRIERGEEPFHYCESGLRRPSESRRGRERGRGGSSSRSSRLDEVLAELTSA
ncbi:unnamed protein product [Vitrella brassicaformis CCMP3155]|uniref:Peptidylprolyl isomerase n=1 Tax=Vitrella brassicaformis (strain CCMP3155) TaxID=1169540 RepID=A0A0G4ERE5_VITBC|nr:unnamed protein product [Vitrella brassicaformis CCMP3155]|eukprot:CEM00604.1 unnamed protein product [Vitrella brassicaformis CCMP3155]